MPNSPFAIVVMMAISLYVIWLWFSDFRATRAGQPNPRALPGATPAPVAALAIAALGAGLILAGETWGEIALGVSNEQSNVTALFAAYTLCAAFVEEIIFRGFIVVENRGKTWRWVSVFIASILFAALHPFLWDWKDGHLLWTFSTKGWFSASTVFASSLWFYFVRFAPFNPRRSLLPCFAAHLAKNLGVIAIKGVQGHLAGWW